MRKISNTTTAWAALGWLMVWMLLPPGAVAQSLSPDLGARLQGLRLSQAERDAGAVILNRRVDVRTNSAGQFEMTVYVAAHIVSRAAAADYSEVGAGFNAHYTQASVDFARVRATDGTVREVSNDAIQVAAPDQTGMFNDQRILRFALPSLTPGATLEFQIRRRSIRGRVPGRDDLMVYFHSLQDVADRRGIRIDPVRDATLSITVPSAPKLVHEAWLTEVSPRVSHGDDGMVTYQWTLANLPGLVPEGNMPPISDLLPSVQVSTMATWSVVDSWANGLFAPAMQPTATLRSQARKITADARTDRDKVEALYYFMQRNVRYIEADVDRGGYTPHHADVVLRNAYGDCKDQSALLVAMLRSLGIPAFPALIGSFPEARVNPNLPSTRFSHMIVYVPLAAEKLWLDTSGRGGRFPGVSWVLEGREAFVVDGAGGELVRLPRSTAADNRYVVDVHFSYLGAGGLQAALSFQPTGAYERVLKSAFKHNPSARTEIRDMVRGIYAAGTVAGVEYTGIDNDAEPLRISAKVNFPNQRVSRQPIVIAGSLDQLLGPFTSLLTLVPAPERRNDYIIPYPYQLTMRVHSPLPPGDYRHIVSVPSIDQKYADFRVTRTIERGADGVAVEVEFMTKGERVEREDYARFFADVEHASSRGKWSVLFSQRSGEVQAAKAQGGRVVDAAASLNDGVSTDQVRGLLRRGEFEEARELAQRLLAADAENGEAHYLLGLALGYLDRFDESDAALTRAKALGYHE